MTTLVEYDAWYEVQYFGAKGWIQFPDSIQPYVKDRTGISRSNARGAANRIASIGTNARVRVIHCTVQKLFLIGGTAP